MVYIIFSYLNYFHFMFRGGGWALMAIGACPEGQGSPETPPLLQQAQQLSGHCQDAPAIPSAAVSTEQSAVAGPVLAINILLIAPEHLQHWLPIGTLV